MLSDETCKALKKQRDKTSKRISIALSKKITWKQRRGKEETFWHRAKRLQFMKVTTPPVIKHLSRYGLVCSRSCFCVQQQRLNTQAVTKQELPEYQPERSSTYQTDSIKKRMNKKKIAEADSLVDNFFSCPRIKFSNAQTLIRYGVETGFLLSDFAQ